MRIAYFDCFSGLSGEMMLGALLSAGLPLEALSAALARLPLGEYGTGDYRLEARAVMRQGVLCSYLSLTEDNQVVGRSGHARSDSIITVAQTKRRSPTLQQIVGDSSLPTVVKQTALAALARLSLAESVVRSTHPNVASLEPGMKDIDTLVTVVGVIAGLSLLKIDRVECSPLHVSGGVTQVTYGNGINGIEPALSPVAAEALRAAYVPVYASATDAEPVTAAGAAIIATIASAFGPMPPMKMRRVGYGAGKRDLEASPNFLRIFIGDSISRPTNMPTPTPAPRPIPQPTISTSNTDPEIVKAARLTTEPISIIPIDSERTATRNATAEAVAAKPYITSQEEWIALTLKGHQQSGRQRVGRSA